MSHSELITYGCEFCKQENSHGETLSGYWLDGVYLGDTPQHATEAIRG